MTAEERLDQLERTVQFLLGELRERDDDLWFLRDLLTEHVDLVVDVDAMLEAR